MENAVATESEMISEETDGDDDAPPSPTSSETSTETSDGKKAKKPARRKPIWLVVPVEFADVVQDDGEIVKQPSRYEIFECGGKPEVAKVLERFQKAGTIDGTNVHHIKAFRADPLPLKMSTQVAIKF